MDNLEEQLRLQVYLARCGIGNRRKCEEYISEGRVSVNGKAILTPGYKVTEGDEVFYNGRPVHPEKEHVYIALHKPSGFICSNQDRDGRPLAIDLLTDASHRRLYNVGRLDYMTSGLLFFTNDGDFSKLMTHPSSHVEKEYVVTTKKRIPGELMEQFKKGISVHGEFFRLKQYTFKGSRTVHIVLEEGKNKELRKVFLSRSITLKSIHRVRIGNIKLTGLASGHFRKLTPKEVDQLKKQALENKKNNQGETEKMIVAIDGPAGVGKNSIASKVAKQMNFFNLNSGNFYRAVSLLLLRESLGFQDEKRAVELAEKADMEIQNNRLIMDGEDVDDTLHSDEIDRIVAQVSAIVPIRHIVNDKLRKISQSLDLVAEGRDMTTVVFPDAEVKIFLDASPEVRAGRRFKQGVSGLSYDAILEGIRQRDIIDRNKKRGSLIIADDALYLDTSALTLEQVCEKVTDKIKELN